MRCSSGPRCTSRPERDHDAPGGALRCDREGCAARAAVCFEPAAVDGEYGVQPQCISEGHQGRVSVVYWHVGVAPHEQRDLGVQAAIEAEMLLAANQRLNTAYLLKEFFGQLWDYKREGRARRFFVQWRAALEWQRLKPYQRFAEMIERPHRERTVLGGYERAQETLPAGTVVVRVDQPLDRLAFYLLEPRSDDGLLDWNLLDGALANARSYPIVRTFAAP